FLVFAELGAQYEFERPNDGKILTGDLSEVTPSPWAFSLRSGFRMLLNDNLQIEATGGYLSFGQEDLDVWEGKLHLSWSF
ncbi:autotransporter outer membrane beta-barrel domain-containing protein, partial [Sinorhizobium meliloti]